MAVTGGVWMIIVVQTVILTVGAELACDFHKPFEITCTPKCWRDNVLKEGVVSDNDQTTAVILADCKITEIQLQSFRNLNSVTSLDLSRNKLRSLHVGIFDDVTQLKILYLSYNMLTSIPLGLFDCNSKLKVVCLKNNNINSSLRGVFDNLTNLEILKLRDNKALGNSFDPYTFESCIQTSSQQNLHLYPSCSPTVFNKLHNLKLLGLSHNALKSVHGQLFNALHKIEKLYLHNNLLKAIPETLFQNLTHLVYINLSQNLLEYMPENAFRGTSLEYLKLSNNKFTYLSDVFFSELMTTRASLSHVVFDHNPWQCACLMEVLNEVNKLGITYNDETGYTGKEPVCVTTEKYHFRCIKRRDLNQYYIDMYYNVTLQKV